MINNKFRWIPPILWGVLIAVLSLIPASAIGIHLLGIKHIDKVAHFGIYAIWAFLIVLALSDRSQTSGMRAMWIAVIIGTLTGIMLEYGQYFMRLGRNFEVLDMVANTCGAMIGAWTGRVFYKFQNQSKRTA